MTGDGASQLNATAEALTHRQQRAALMVAEDEITDQAIADTIGVNKVTLERWKLRPVFAIAVAEHREAFKDAALSEGFADKRQRIKLLNLLGEALFVQLSKSEFQSVLRMTDDGEAVHGFDAARVREFRGTLDDIAKEMGDRATKTEITGKDGEPLLMALVGIDTERV